MMGWIIAIVAISVIYVIYEQVRYREIESDDLDEYKAPPLIRFQYMDREGNITDRGILAEVKTDKYLQGFCLDRNEDRTFLIDSIIEFSDESSRREFNDMPEDDHVDFN